MKSLQAKYGEIVWKSHHLHLMIGRASAPGVASRPSRRLWARLCPLWIPHYSKAASSIYLVGEELAQLAPAAHEPLGIRVGHARNLHHVLDPGWRTSQHDDTVAEDQGLLEAARYEDDRHVGPQDYLVQFPVQPVSGLGVEPGERLVHQQHQRVERELPRYVVSLLHAPRELVREMVRSVLEARHLQIPSGRLFTFIPAPAHDTKRIRDVVHHRAPGEELVGLLEDHGPVRPRTQVLSAGEGDDPTIRPDEAGYRLEECGFSAPGRP